MLAEIDTARQENSDIYTFCISYLLRNRFKIIYADKACSNEEVAAADILITGHQLNPFSYLSRSNLFVFPSTLEGFPNALMEAMVCGLPVVSSDCPTGPKDILTDNHTNESFGILLPVFDHFVDLQDEAFNENHLLWAETIINLLQDNALLKELQKKSLCRANQYAMETVCKKWLNILEA